MTKGMVHRQRHTSTGNGCLLAIVNSDEAYWDYAIVEETVVLALEHLGMPYRILDLARERLTAETANAAAALLIAQNRLGGSLTQEETAVIADAVRNGVGLVNLDNDLRLYKAPLLEIFGFEGINPHPYTTNIIRSRPTGHYITGMQDPGEFHTFHRMTTAIIAERWRPDVIPLAEGILGKDQLVYIRHLAPWSAFEPGNYACLFAARWGRGKAVQFTLNPRVWRKEFYGHDGLGDLFWRSIVWAVRKPFAANLIPPFVTMSVDDCSGRHDFAYADIARQHGHRPVVSLFLKTIPRRLYAKIRDGQKSGDVLYNTHAMNYYDLLMYDFGKGESSPEKLREQFAFNDAFWKDVGVKPCNTIRGHWGEYGRLALPYLKERGHRYFCPALQMGLHKADMCMSDGFWPYNLQTRYYDYLPDDNDFMGFASFPQRGTEDFLAGCTTLLRESEFNDVEKAARSGASHLLRGLRAGFYGELVFHEQKFEVLQLDEWDRILARIAQLLGSREIIHSHHDEVGPYLRGKDNVRIAESGVESGNIRCRLKGRTAAALRLSVFRDEDEGVVRQYQAVAPFDGELPLG
ncbi:MAG: hypothetical protein HY343_10695 [Lentisphaerae bacterium]|nr:hypothetical protein [Lentisphaerota bacterium]